jgi:hypothetical protein
VLIYRDGKAAANPPETELVVEEAAFSSGDVLRSVCRPVTDSEWSLRRLSNRKEMTLRILETRCAVACMAAIFSAASPAAGQGDEFIGAATTKVAPRWEEGMLTGNGNMGGIALGNPYSETLYMTQQEGFLPRHRLPKVPRIASRMPELKKMALEAGNGGPALFTSKVKETAGVRRRVKIT